MRHRGSPRCRRPSLNCAARRPRLVVRRYLPCVRQRVSDTDSDDIPLCDVLATATGSTVTNLECHNSITRQLTACIDMIDVDPTARVNNSYNNTSSDMEPLVNNRRALEHIHPNAVHDAASALSLPSTPHDETVSICGASTMYGIRPSEPLSFCSALPIEFNSPVHAVLSHKSLSLCSNSAVDPPSSNEPSLTLSDVAVPVPKPSSICNSLSALSNQVEQSIHSSAAYSAALPLFRDRFRLPSFTGQRRWHSMFGQFEHPFEYVQNNADVTSTDEDILADGNLDSLFDSTEHTPLTVDQNQSNVGEMFEQNRDSSQRLRLPFTMDRQRGNLNSENDVQHREQLNTLPPQHDSNLPTRLASPPADAGLLESIVGDLSAETFPLLSALFAGQTNRENPAANLSNNSSICRRERRHSAPSSSGGSSATGSRSSTVRSRSGNHGSRSGTVGSRSGESSQGSWYFYDRRLRSGGVLASFYSRARMRRSLSAIVFPPAYDDIFISQQQQQSSGSTGQEPPASATTIPSSSATAAGTFNDMNPDLPPPYVSDDDVSILPQETSSAVFNPEPPQVPPEIPTHQPPSYAEAVRRDCWPSDIGSRGPCNLALDNYIQRACSSIPPETVERVLPSRCLSSPGGVFGSRPAVRWNRNMRVERWTSSVNWVSS